MSCDEILKKLKSLTNPKNVQGMARFGINSKNTLGIAIADLRKIAKQIGKSHVLAQEIFALKIHEARILASMIDKPEEVTKKQMDLWVKEFDSWDVCDQVCNNLFNKTGFAFEKAEEWVKSKKEFVRRAGFALIACMGWSQKTRNYDKELVEFLPIIKKYSTDERNFVKKAVNWALRNIGKRNKKLNREAIKTAEAIVKMNSKTAKWIAKDALRELQSRAVVQNLA